jgi:hypothetical protein
MGLREASAMCKDGSDPDSSCDTIAAAIRTGNAVYLLT